MLRKVSPLRQWTAVNNIWTARMKIFSSLRVMMVPQAAYFNISDTACSRWSSKSAKHDNDSRCLHRNILARWSGCHDGGWASPWLRSALANKLNEWSFSACLGRSFQNNCWKAKSFSRAGNFKWSVPHWHLTSEERSFSALADNLKRWVLRQPVLILAIQTIEGLLIDQARLWHEYFLWVKVPLHFKFASIFILN
jgi:hypothetical protein